MKKKRDENGLFVAEGPRLVSDMLKKYRCRYIAVTENSAFVVPHGIEEADVVTREELSRASLLTTPHEVLAIFEKPLNAKPVAFNAPCRDLCLALDDVQDPGNVGTILRTAAWFGIDNVYCSTGTADVFSPKVLQATMGALAVVNVVYCDLVQMLSAAKGNYPVYGTFPNGMDIYTTQLERRGIIIIGNEGNGISPAIATLVTHAISVPSYPAGRQTVESLNASMAAAIICAEFCRRR